MIPEETLLKPGAPCVLLAKGHKERVLPDDFSIFQLDAGRMKNLEGLYDEMSSVLSLPDYFGRNFNALEECLTDLEWIQANGYLVVIKNADLLLSDEPFESLEGLLSVLEDVGREWGVEIAEGNVWDRAALPFHVILELSEGEGLGSSSRYQDIEPPIAFLSC